jgi:hypothetical protein
MIVNSIDLESIVTMLNQEPAKHSKSEIVRFAKGSHSLVDNWSTFLKHLK